MNFSDRRLKVTIGDNTLNTSGVLAVKQIFTNMKIYIPSDFSWELVNRRGSLAKRLKKLVTLNMAWNNINNNLSQIINVHGNPIRDIYFKATKSYWKDGDFKDHGSCYWYDYYYCRSVIRQYGGAIQLFNESYEKGLGRCWVVQDKDKYIIFNAYGYSLKVFADILAKYYDLTASEINIESDYAYINNGGGFLLSNEVDEIEYYDLDNLIDWKKYVKCCSYCHNLYLLEDIKDHCCGNGEYDD